MNRYSPVLVRCHAYKIPVESAVRQPAHCFRQPCLSAGTGNTDGSVRRWVINDELSDNTDDQVEEAIEAGGGKGSRGSLIVRRLLSWRSAGA